MIVNFIVGPSIRFQNKLCSSFSTRTSSQSDSLYTLDLKSFYTTNAIYRQIKFKPTGQYCQANIVLYFFRGQIVLNIQQRKYSLFFNLCICFPVQSKQSLTPVSSQTGYQMNLQFFLVCLHTISGKPLTQVNRYTHCMAIDLNILNDSVFHVKTQAFK